MGGEGANFNSQIHTVKWTVNGTSDTVKWKSRKVGQTFSLPISKGQQHQVAVATLWNFAVTYFLEFGTSRISGNSGFPRNSMEIPDFPENPPNFWG